MYQKQEVLQNLEKEGYSKEQGPAGGFGDVLQHREEHLQEGPRLQENRKKYQHLSDERLLQVNRLRKEKEH